MLQSWAFGSVEINTLQQKLERNAYMREYNKRPIPRQKKAAKDKQWQLANRDLMIGYRRAYRTRNPDQKRNYDLYKRYGLEREKLETMLHNQNGGCAICSTPIVLKGRGKFAVDHDHSNGAIRGILCTRCNFIVGVVEQRDLVMACLKYLGER